MFLGHIGVGLALKRAAPSVNVGLLVAGALVADFLLGLFILLGLERVHVPTDFAHRHFLTFTFPWSHGLAATAAWAGAAGGLTYGLLRGPARAWGALVVALAVASHFPCDAIEHVPELPLWGVASPQLGLGLWRWMPAALALEVALAVWGLLLYRRASPGAFPLGMALLLVALAALALPGQLLSTSAPSGQALVATWLLEVPLIGALAGWLDGRRQARAEKPP